MIHELDIGRIHEYAAVFPKNKMIRDTLDREAFNLYLTDSPAQSFKKINTKIYTLQLMDVYVSDFFFIILTLSKDS